MTWQELNSLAAKGGWFLLIVLVYVVVFHYDKLGIIISDLYRLFAWTGKFFQKKYVALDIQSRINLGAKKLSRETKDLMPLSLEIKWVKPQEVDRDVFIKERKAILRLDYYLNQDKNLTNVVQQFVTKVHLSEPKAYLTPKLGQSVDLRLTARYLAECGRREALSYFVKNVLEPALNDGEVESFYRKLEELEEFGYFTRVLLVEFIQLARELFPAKVGLPLVLDETTRFVDFLAQFPPRPPGSEIELDFRGRYIKVRFVLVAKHFKITVLGNEPYVKRIADALTSFADTVYVCAMDKMIGAAASVAKQATEEFGLQLDYVQTYGALHREVRRSAVILRLRRKK